MWHVSLGLNIIHSHANTVAHTLENVRKPVLYTLNVWTENTLHSFLKTSTLFQFVLTILPLYFKQPIFVSGPLYVYSVNFRLKCTENARTVITLQYLYM